jgi:hypothetical protein
MPDFLDEKRQEIAVRLKELKPLVEEHDRLEAAAGALDRVGTAPPARSNGSATSAAPSGRKRGGPRGSKDASATATTAKTAPAKQKQKAEVAAKEAAHARRRRWHWCRSSLASRSANSLSKWASRRPTSIACFPTWRVKARSRSGVAAGTPPHRHACCGRSDLWSSTARLAQSRR